MRGRQETEREKKERGKVKAGVKSGVADTARADRKRPGPAPRSKDGLTRLGKV